MISTCLITEIKQQLDVSTWMDDRLSALLVSLMASQLMLVVQNPFQPCLSFGMLDIMWSFGVFDISLLLYPELRACKIINYSLPQKNYKI